MFRLSNNRFSAQLVVGTVVLLSLTHTGRSQTTIEEGETTSSDTQEEIVVIGEKTSLTLRQELNAAQEVFFAKFNDLNSDDKFDFECEIVVDLATRRRHHVCIPDFARKIESSINRDMMIRGNWWGDASYAGPGRRDQSQLLQEMVELLRENPELREAQLAVAKAKQAYQAASDKR